MPASAVTVKVKYWEPLYRFAVLTRYMELRPCGPSTFDSCRILREGVTILAAQLHKFTSRRKTMPARNPREVFLMLLSNVRNRTERAADIYPEIGKHAEEPEIKEAIEARAFASN
jgi:hypothetical protein